MIASPETAHVIELVEEAIERAWPGNVPRPQLEPSESFSDSIFLYIPVRFDPPIRQRLPYYEAMSSVERFIFEGAGIRVMLVPDRVRSCIDDPRVADRGERRMSPGSLETVADVTEYVAGSLAELWPEHVRDLDPVVHSVRQEDECWNVHLEPKFWPEQSLPFYEALAALEGRIAREIESTGRYIVLVPHHPED